LESCWKAEGLAVLAWALGRLELPAYDECVDPQAACESVRFLDPAAAESLLASPKLRSPQEIKRLSDQLFALHWRLREFSLRGQPMNLREFAGTAWFGPLDLSAARLLSDDLAIGDDAISEADDYDVQMAENVVQSRRVAVLWLQGAARHYSKVQPST
jgi:hypothetical protein